VLAANARLRARVVPQGPAQEERTTEAATGTAREGATAKGRPHRIGWARLLKRVFDIDMQHCPNCGTGDRVHRRHPAAASDREEPHAPGAAGASAPRAAARVHMQQVA
jgi:hypothetical protein